MRLAAALLALTLAACPGEPPPRELKSGAVSVQVPAAWQVGKSPESEWMVRPVENGEVVPGAFVLLASDPPKAETPVSLDQYVTYREGWAGASWERLRVVDQGRVNLGGTPAERREWHGEGRMPARRMLSLLWVDEAGGHALVASAPAQEFDRLRPQFQRLLDSVKLAR